MDAQLIETALRFHITKLRERLEQAAGIAKAAECCAEAGNIDKAIEIALDVEQQIYEANTLLNAASLMNRIGKV
jgi:hypothetical protein